VQDFCVERGGTEGKPNLNATAEDLVASLPFVWHLPPHLDKLTDGGSNSKAVN
jgi:hypothetical protein